MLLKKMFQLKANLNSLLKMKYLFCYFNWQYLKIVLKLSKKCKKCKKSKTSNIYNKKEILNLGKDKFLWTTKVTSKGQIVIPKEAREVFGIKYGDTLLLLGDKSKGLAIAKYDDYIKFVEEIFKAGEQKWC